MVVAPGKRAATDRERPRLHRARLSLPLAPSGLVNLSPVMFARNQVSWCLCSSDLFGNSWGRSCCWHSVIYRGLLPPVGSCIVPGAWRRSNDVGGKSRHVVHMASLLLSVAPFNDGAMRITGHHA